jgi:hypothetical protein
MPFALVAAIFRLVVTMFVFMGLAPIASSSWMLPFNYLLARRLVPE